MISFPTKKETWIVLGITAIYLLLTATFVGFRPEHILITLLFFLLFFPNKETRKLAVAVMPFVVFAISYDWMRVYPNYKVNPIDVQGLYAAEKSLFGITIDGVRMIPCEYFANHHNSIGDFFGGIFYLTWVPVPILFGLWLYFKKDRSLYLRFAIVFLFVNLIGFAGYYIHPAAPPWYAINYGFDPILNTPGNAAGLARFDELLGISIFDSIYGRNANVFAAVPSLHAAYMLIAVVYAIIKKAHPLLIMLLSVLCLGIWFTAVYSCHHYIIDVLLGIGCALIGIAIFELILMRMNFFKGFINSYTKYIS